MRRPAGAGLLDPSSRWRHHSPPRLRAPDETVLDGFEGHRGPQIDYLGVLADAGSRGHGSRWQAIPIRCATYAIGDGTERRARSPNLEELP